MLPLRVLAAIPSPQDAPQFLPDASWQAVASAITPLHEQGLVDVERLTPPTENALKKRLSEGGVHVLHLIGYAAWRPAAQYGTLIFESSSGTSRGLSTQYFAEMLAQHDSVKLAVLQVSAKPGDRMDGPIPSLGEHGPAVIVATGTMDARSQEVFTLKLYASLATGSTLADATALAQTALSSINSSVTISLKTLAPDLRLVEALSSVQSVPSVPREIPLPDAAMAAAAAARDAEALRIRRDLERKRASAEFDVFLCHNWADKPAVVRIADRLETCGILPWLDERELPPGQPWQPLLEKQIANIKAAAVFVGAAGIGPWQEQELNGFLREFVSRQSPVIPVLLQDAPQKPELPIFLRAMTWVDFRVKEPEPLARLIWGITGKRPGN